MNKNLSKNSSKSLRVYILSEIRERRKPSSNLRSNNVRSNNVRSGNVRSGVGQKISINKRSTPLIRLNLRNRQSRVASFPKVLPKTLNSSPTSTKIFKKKENPKVFKVPERKSIGEKYPCLFVQKVDQKTQDVIGSRFINKMIRFITKQGKKAFASECMNKVRSILTNFEADKKDLKKDSISLKSPSIQKLKGLEQKKEDTQEKMSIQFETYKSRKLSEFLSRQKQKYGHHMKSLKKNLKKKFEYSPVSPRILIEQAISSVKPFVEVKKVRVAGSTYQVPAILKKHRQENYAMKWILQSALERHKKNRSQSFEYCLAFEIYEASKKQGQARMKRNELHKLAESHRAFAHFRWW